MRYDAGASAIVTAIAKASMGGICTGEHGIGQGKQKYLKAEPGPEAIDAMRAEAGGRSAESFQSRKELAGGLGLYS